VAGDARLVLCGTRKLPVFLFSLLLVKKVLIICAHRPGRSPSQRYRFEQYLPLLEEQGYRFTWSYLLDEKDDGLFYQKGTVFAKMRILAVGFLKRWRESAKYGSYDIIFIQREAFFAGPNIFERRAAGSGACVIFDYDDSIWVADTSAANKKWEWLKRPGKFYDNVRLATTVIAGNRYLAAEAEKAGKRAMIIPTTIDTDLHRPIEKEAGSVPVVIGWSGSLTTIRHFEMLLPVLRRLKTAHGDRLVIRVMGAAGYSHPELKVESVGWSEGSEVPVLNSFDIGVMPLPDDEWSRGKCGLKALSYMACGVATVASAVGVNKEIIDGSNGVLVSNEEQWYIVLNQLIGDPAFRRSLGVAGRKTVIERYSVAANAHLYVEAFGRCGLT
jgi:glycosyltransferase involved in cell wall biosynthesis